MAFELKKCVSKDGFEFSGLFEMFPDVFGDERGCFFEAYNERKFFDAGLDFKFVQDNQSFSTRGVLRGLHFQKKHPQGKLLCAAQGIVYSVGLDLRNGSATFGKYHGVVLSAKMHNQFYIPKGFAHGFCVLSENATLCYKCTDFYDPKDEGGIIWNDETVRIDWPTFEDERKIVLSEKDKKLPAFNSEKEYFDENGVWLGD